MDDFDVAYSLENEQQFWDGQEHFCPQGFLDFRLTQGIELDEIVSAHCETQSLIDGALKSYLTFTSSFTGILPTTAIARVGRALAFFANSWGVV